MPKNDPLISIVITNYNYGDYVGQAIDSAINQTYGNTEIIVIDDGSTDESNMVIGDCVKKYPEIDYIKQKNLGANATRNKGIEKANGEFIFLLDADNWLNPDHIKQVYKVAVEKDADVVYGDLQRFGDSTEIFVAPEFDLDYLKITNFIDTASLIRKKAIGDNRFDMWLNRRFLQDYDFFLGLALKGLKIVKSPGTALNYRVHGSQNGHKSKDIDKVQKYIENYNYIIQKYSKLYPKQFGPATIYSNSLQTNNLFLEVDLKSELDKLQKQNEDLKTKIHSLYNSPSWKITKPLRYVSHLVRKIVR